MTPYIMREYVSDYSMIMEIVREHAHVADERTYRSSGAQQGEGLPFSANLFPDPKSPFLSQIYFV